MEGDLWMVLNGDLEKKNEGGREEIGDEREERKERKIEKGEKGRRVGYIWVHVHCS